MPAQGIETGVVTIAVIEGHYSAIDLRNQSRPKDSVARGVLAGLDSGDIVESAPPERRLLLLSDIPGVAVRSTLAPGSAVGTSDLIGDFVPDRSVTAASKLTTRATAIPARTAWADPYILTTSPAVVTSPVFGFWRPTSAFYMVGRHIRRCSAMLRSASPTRASIMSLAVNSRASTPAAALTSSVSLAATR